MIRIDKYLADMGLGTRSEIKKAVSKGLVKVDGIVIRKADLKVDIAAKQVYYGQTPVRYTAKEYYMLNKPAGVISATSDKKERTVVELIETRKRKDLFPVGRLDKDTEGLLLITNDGDLAHRLLAPGKHVDKQYFALIGGIVTTADIDSFAVGIDIGEKSITKPARLKIVGTDIKAAQSQVIVTIQEGKFHQIKRMFQQLDKEVLYLKRLSMGPLKLDEALAPGQYRELKKEELESLC